MLLIVLIAMTGAMTVQGASAITSAILRSAQGSDGGSVRLLSWTLWTPFWAVAVVTGLLGPYQALRDQSLNKGLLVVAPVLACFQVKVDGVALGWAGFQLGLLFGDQRFAYGINLVGVVSLIWLLEARRLGVSRLRPPPNTRMDGTSGADD